MTEESKPWSNGMKVYITSICAGTISAYAVGYLNADAETSLLLGKYNDTGFILLISFIFIISYILAFMPNVERRKKTYSIHIKLPDMVIEKEEDGSIKEVIRE